MNVLSVLNVILLISASLLCLALIYYLYKITKSFEEIKNKVNELSSELKPLIASTTELSDKLNDITVNARDQVDMTRNIIGNIKDRVDIVLGFEERMRSKIEEPTLGLIRNVSAVVNGIAAFWNSYRKH
jgi:uncharacterized protein YoxC